jgi:hypothetical protein
MRPGTERAVRVGGPGTPEMAEFACAELGARLQLSPWSARRLIADALDARHRLPAIWTRVLAGQARVGTSAGRRDGRLRRRVPALGPVHHPAGRDGPAPRSTAPPGSTSDPRSG